MTREEETTGGAIRLMKRRVTWRGPPWLLEVGDSCTGSEIPVATKSNAMWLDGMGSDHHLQDRLGPTHICRTTSLEPSVQKGSMFLTNCWRTRLNTLPAEERNFPFDDSRRALSFIRSAESFLETDCESNPTTDTSCNRGTSSCQDHSHNACLLRQRA